jgi:hypothetical protein
MQWPARSQDLNPIENVQMSCLLLTAWVDGVKPSFMLEVEIYATEPFSLVYFFGTRGPLNARFTHANKNPIYTRTR